MRRVRFARLPLLLALSAAVTPLLVPGDAAAGWPPAPDATPADLAKPASWPNDPGYAYSATANGQWNLYSFMPDVAHPRPAETASGMSVDMAWRLTIGDPSVKIVITDSGIKWDEADLIEKAYLNDKELVNHKPKHADGTTCGGDGPLAGFDCNNDGVLSVGDYTDTPELAPEASPGHPKGDMNNNGVLDAGDLILNFSDKIDDDGNGYVDDISGWDFMKDDNDPYDDTRYGHGTGEARDSTAATNNLIGDAGVCPLCRFVPTRAGDSFITDATSFAKAVVYAADNDAPIVQCALGTINTNQFTQAALDYAYEKGTLVITSMADENSRHHNMPAAQNHTLPVHAINFDASSITEASTFLGFHPCSNFGGQNLLSASGSGCSSEATGKLAGMAGLLYSAAIKYKVNPPLLPGEAQSIFFTTADDIDVPESQMPDANYKWSQPGFDQRFGYGRVNANKAVEAIRDGKIPPAVDVTSPTWFSVLYKDQVEGPIDIKGTVSAKRANSFDYVVEWAPGVQPLDGEFKAIQKEITNIPPTMVIGEDGPLATLDIRTLDIKHDRDSDSLSGENDTAITVRVRSVAHYGAPIGDVRGEMRRSYFVQSDPTLVKGFPIFLGDSGEGNPKMADIDMDGDGVSELIYPTGGGRLHVLKMTKSGPVELPGFPFKTSVEDGLVSPAPTKDTPVYLAAPAYASGKVDPKIANEPMVNAPAIADLDGDGKPEIVMSTYAGTIYVIGSDGQPKPGWPKRLPNVPSCPLDPTVPVKQPCMNEDTRLARGAFASPVLIDMDKDGKLDIIQAAFDGKIYIYHADGSDVAGWPVEVHYTGSLSGEPQRNRIVSTPAVADFNGDGIPELLVGSNERLGNGGAGGLYLIDGRGMKAPKLTMPSWPQVITSLQIFPLVAEGVPNAGVIGRFGGTLAGVMHGNATLPLILPLDPGAQATLGETPPNALPKRDDPFHPGKTAIGLDPSSIFGPLSLAKTPNTMLPLFAQPSLGDLDQDGYPDVITSGGSLDLAIGLQGNGGNGPKGDNLLAMWSGKTGAMMPASPMVLEDFTFLNSQAVADLNGDDYPEVITGSGGYFVHAFDACGREPAGFPKFTGGWIIPTVAVGDLDGDKKLEIVTGTRDGWLYAWHTEGKSDGIIEWESFHHDNRNTGNLEEPLDQGTKKKAAKPLTAEMCTAVTPPTVDAPPLEAGGCQCEAAGHGGAVQSAPAALGLVGIAMAALRRRRRAA